MTDETFKHTPPAMLLYCASLMSSVLGWGLPERGAYITFLCYAWDHGGLPLDELSRRRILGCSKHEHGKIWQTVGPKFVEHDGTYINLRQESERSKNQRWREKQSEYGKAGAKKRWATHSPPNGSPKAISIVPISTVQPQQIADLWNQHTTSPIPKVRSLTDARRAKVRRRLEEVADVAVWERLFKYINRQDWCRANGQGKYSNWTASFDWIIRSEDTLLGQIEKMETPTPITPLREVKPRGRLAKIRAGNMALTGETE